MQKLLTPCVFIVLIMLSSCAGYRFQQSANPFAQYGVKSISIPMFYNQSNFPNISAPMTKEIYHVLSKFNDLELRSGDQEADAVLIGIVMSPDKVRRSMIGEDFRSAKNVIDEIGDQRGDFYIPARTRLQSSLRLVLLKNPTPKEIELLKSGLGRFAIGSKIIINETIALTSSFNRELYSGEALSVVDTQNRGAMRNSIEEMAKSAAQNFKDMVLYAF